MENRFQSNRWKTFTDPSSCQLRWAEYLSHFKKRAASGTTRKASLDTDARR